MEKNRNNNRETTRNILNRQMRKLFVIMISSVLVLGCGKKETTSTQPPNETKKDSLQKVEGNDVTKNPEGQKKDSAISKNPVLKWEFKSLGTGKHDEPITQVYVVVNGKKFEIQKIEFGFSDVVKDSYADHHIPDEAIIACRGWWAGAGIDYWVTRNNRELLVFSREIGETSTEDGEPSDYEGKPQHIKSITIE